MRARAQARLTLSGTPPERGLMLSLRAALTEPAFKPPPALLTRSRAGEPGSSELASRPALDLARPGGKRKGGGRCFGAVLRLERGSNIEQREIAKSNNCNAKFRLNQAWVPDPLWRESSRVGRASRESSRVELNSSRVGVSRVGFGPVLIHESRFWGRIYAISGFRIGVS